MSKSAVEDYRVLDLSSLRKRGALQAGHGCTWGWWQDSDMVASIGIEAAADSIRLRYNADGKAQDYSIWLDRTPCHYGGHRVWFRCPAVGCGRRVAKLYGGAIFACRHCYQMNYASQQWSQRDRGINQSWRLRRKMGCELGWLDLPADYVPKPKGKHWKTHERDIARLNRYDATASASFSQIAASVDAMLTRLALTRPAR